MSAVTGALAGHVIGVYAAALARCEAEVSTYPQPIPGCDAQFNHLLEQRRALRRVQRTLANVAGDEVALRREAEAALDWLDASARTDLHAALEG